MTGFTYTDSRTGAMTYYTSSGGEFNSAAAERSVAANSLVRQGRLVPTQPILYDIFGQNTWVVPVVADNGKYQTLALVQAAGGHVVVGNPSAPATGSDAFAQYQAFLGDRATGAAGAAVQTITGTLDRYAVAAGRLYFTLRERRGVFTMIDPSDPAALLARPGDRVQFVATPDAGGLLLVRDLRDDTLNR
jgi:hypothetical protein